MDIRDLSGPHILCGVDVVEGNMLLVLDDTTYEAIEDPDDGYRSYMRSFEVSAKTVVNRFKPIPVECETDDDWMSIRSVATGKICLRIGTDSQDSYYPLFVAEWEPLAACVRENQ
jgi:hypothetical protein